MYIAGWSLVWLVLFLICFAVAKFFDNLKRAKTGALPKVDAGEIAVLTAIITVILGVAVNVLISRSYQYHVTEEVFEYKLLAFEDQLGVDGSIYKGVFTFRMSTTSSSHYLARIQREDGGSTVQKYYTSETWTFDTLTNPADARVVRAMDRTKCGENYTGWVPWFIDCTPSESFVEYRIYIPVGSIQDAGNFNLNLSD